MSNEYYSTQFIKYIMSKIDPKKLCLCEYAINCIKYLILYMLCNYICIEVQWKRAPQVAAGQFTTSNDVILLLYYSRQPAAYTNMLKLLNFLLMQRVINIWWLVRRPPMSTEIKVPPWILM